MESEAAEIDQTGEEGSPEATETLRAAVLQHAPPDEALRRELIGADLKSDCIVARGGRRAAVVVFTGPAGLMGMPLTAFDRYLAALDLTAVYLRDRKRLGFLGGVASLARDYDGSLVRLKELMVDLGAMTVHAMGNATGGIGAVSYGLDLRARTVLCFSSPVVLTREALAVDPFTAAFGERILRGNNTSRRDLRARVLASRGQTQVRLCFNPDSAAEAAHAEALAEAASVRLQPVADPEGRGALIALATSGGLAPLFAELYGDKD